MGMLHVFLGVNWYVELIASIRIKIGATEAISEAAEAGKLALLSLSFISYKCFDTSNIIIASW